MKKKTLLTVAFISTLLLSAVAGIQFVNLGTANPLYTIPKMTIESPQNTTYNVNMIPLNFSVEIGYSLSFYSFFYSLDGEAMKPVENVISISKEEMIVTGDISITTRENLVGNCVLSNLSEGWHNLTVYSRYTEEPRNIDLIHSANTTFRVETVSQATLDSFPTTTTTPLPTSPVLVASTIAAVAAAGVLVYFTKLRKATGKAEPTVEGEA